MLLEAFCWTGVKWESSNANCPHKELGSWLPPLLGGGDFLLFRNASRILFLLALVLAWVAFPPGYLSWSWPGSGASPGATLAQGGEAAVCHPRQLDEHLYL